MTHITSPFARQFHLSLIATSIRPQKSFSQPWSVIRVKTQHCQLRFRTCAEEVSSLQSPPPPDLLVISSQTKVTGSSSQISSTIFTSRLSSTIDYLLDEQRERYELGMMGKCFHPVHYVIHRRFAREEARIQEIRDFDEDQREERRLQRELRRQYANVMKHITSKIDADMAKLETENRANRINATVSKCAQVWRTKARENLVKRSGVANSEKVKAAFQILTECQRQEKFAFHAFQVACAARMRAEEERYKRELHDYVARKQKFVASLEQEKKSAQAEKEIEEVERYINSVIEDTNHDHIRPKNELRDTPPRMCMINGAIERNRWKPPRIEEEWQSELSRCSTSST
ncbi:unnamed protein product [Orchesella dallaii]|uniref:Centrosomal protein POC5 n=1 Tax=Orchesella dallaii TaxID=48710 RepID=A0ABP1QNL6_9HEXA